MQGIPFSHEDKLHDGIQELLLLRRRTKGNFALVIAGFRIGLGLSAENLLDGMTN